MKLSWIAFAVVLCSMGCTSRNAESLVDARSKIELALDKRDGKALMAYMTDQERDAVGADATKLDAFLKGPFQEGFADFSRSGDLKVVVDEPGWLAYEQWYESPDHRRVGMVMQIYATEDGPKLSPLLSPLVLAMFATTRPAADGMSPDSLRTAWAKGAKELGPKLVQVGLRQMLVNKASGDKVFTWEQWRQESIK